MTTPVLIADTDEPTRELLKKTLGNKYPLVIVESPSHALKITSEKRKPRLALIGINQSVNGEGENIFAAIRKQEPEMTVIALGERNTEKETIEAVRMGASGYMIKPLNPHEIISIAEKNSRN